MKKYLAAFATSAALIGGLGTATAQACTPQIYYDSSTRGGIYGFAEPQDNCSPGLLTVQKKVFDLFWVDAAPAAWVGDGGANAFAVCTGRNRAFRTKVVTFFSGVFYSRQERC